MQFGRLFSGRRECDVWKGLVAGAIGGLAASVVMNQFQALLSRLAGGGERSHGAQFMQQGGIALPLLLDLALKPTFLHDDTVRSLDELFDPKRGATSPHSFYLPDSKQRGEVIEFLKSLDTDRMARR